MKRNIISKYLVVFALTVVSCNSNAENEIIHIPGSSQEQLNESRAKAIEAANQNLQSLDSGLPDEYDIYQRNQIQNPPIQMYKVKPFSINLQQPVILPVSPFTSPLAPPTPPTNNQ